MLRGVRCFNKEGNWKIKRGDLNAIQVQWIGEWTINQGDSVKFYWNCGKNRIRMDKSKGKCKTNTKVCPIYDIKFW